MKILVVGSGTMGAGIAQVCAQAGFETVLNDIDLPRLEAAQSSIAKFIQRAAEKGQISSDQALAAIARLSVETDLEKAAFSTDWVIEAIYENMAAKQALLRRLEAASPTQTQFASNTSGLSISELASALKNPHRLIGLHFFNPVPLMKLVEVVRGAETEPQTVESALALTKALGKTAVVCDDSPSFIVNRINRPVYFEAQLLVSEGVPPQNVDKALQLGANFRLGPLATGDLSGLEIGLAVSENIFREFGDGRYRPIPLVKKLVRAQHLGRKSGRGFYLYPPGATEPQPNPLFPSIGLPTMPAPQKIAVIGEGSEARRLKGKLSQRQFELVEPHAAQVVLVPPDEVENYSSYFATGIKAAKADAIIGVMNPLASVTELGAASGRPAQTLGLHCPISFLNDKFYEVRLGLETTLESAGTLTALLNRMDYTYVVSPETPAGIVLRVICCLINEAAVGLQEGLASISDIDLALTLGMNYGLGPFQYADRMGLDLVLQVLQYLQTETGDPRYRPAPLLKRYVRAQRLGQETGQGFYEYF